MADVTKFPTTETNSADYISGYDFTSGRSWTNEASCMAEDGASAYTNGMSYSLGDELYLAAFVIDGAGAGDLTLPTPPVTTLAWSTGMTLASTPTPAQVNASTFGIDIGYKVGSSSKTGCARDLYTYTYGFAIPTGVTISSVVAYVKHYYTGTSSRVVYVDAMKIAVSYPDAYSDSPSSNAYSGGPMMFKPPNDLLRVLKKPLYTQMASPRKVCPSFNSPVPLSA